MTISQAIIGTVGERGKPAPTLSEAGGTYNANGARVLVVDDDPAMRHMLLDYLRKQDLRASPAASRLDLLRAMSSREPDLILLDLHAGRHEMFDLLREIRSRSNVPVIFTSDDACDEVNRVLALEMGADDCLVKPFSPRELLARIRALLRRNVIARDPARRPPERGGFRFAGWQVHRRSHRLIAPNGETVPLTKGEYALLVAFLGSPQQPLSRHDLLQATRIHDDASHRSVDVQIMRLRRKLENDPAAPRFIQTERGYGYVFALPVEQY